MKHGGFSIGAKEFLEVMRERKVDRVYFGHIHGFGTLELDGTRYILSGGGGSPMYPTPWVKRHYHFLEVTIGPQGIKDTVHPLNAPSFPIK